MGVVPGARDENRAHAEPERALDVGRQAVADHHGLAWFDGHLSKRRFEDAAVRLHVAVVERRDGDGEEPFEREVALERRQGTLGVRDEADLHA